MRRIRTLSVEYEDGGIDTWDGAGILNVSNTSVKDPDPKDPQNKTVTRELRVATVSLVVK